MAFSGFPADTFRFLSGLAANNSKAWFDAHRADYEAFHLAPAKAFVEAIAPKLKAVSKTLNAEPRVNGSIFRLNRDVRFSKDKSPYKTTLDLWFWEGSERSWETPGYFLRLMPKTFIAGAGIHQFSPAQLQAYRAAVADAKAGAALEKAISGLGDLELGEATRKKLPRGIDAGHPRSALLLHDGLHAEFEGPLPKTTSSPAFVETCAEIFRRAAPIPNWLLKHVVKA